jgi:hypothetical protein
MGANIAGIYGAQIFRADDKPLYRRGFSIGIGVLTFGLVLATIRYIDDRIRRRRNAGQLEAETASNTPSDEKSGSKTPPQSNTYPQQSPAI